MFITFLIDQIQQFSCKYFKAALLKCKSRIYLWEKVRGLFFHYFLLNWQQMYLAISHGFQGARLEDLLDTS